MNAEYEAVNGAEEITATFPIEIMLINGRPLIIKNTIFLLGQCLAKGITPTIVGDAHQWQAQGRTVKEGETSLKIFAPGQRKFIDGKGDKEHEEYRLFCVFDISQTVEIGEGVKP